MNGCVQLQAAGDEQGAQDAAAVHGDDKDKAPAKSASLCGFRVLLSTLGNVKEMTLSGTSLRR